MQTFKLDLALQTRIVVPQHFLTAMREAAQAEDANEFLKSTQERFPEDDDAFILAVLKNGLRKHVRHSVLDLFGGSGLGGSVSPLSLAVLDIEAEEEAELLEAVTPQGDGDSGEAQTEAVAA